MSTAQSGADEARAHSDQLDVLYRAEYEPMVRLAYNLIGSKVEAEELVQDSFVDVYQRLAEIRSPGGYLRTAVVSRARSVLRRRRVMALHTPEPPSGLSSHAGDLWDVLAKLSEDQRVAVVLRYFGGYRATEIAEIVDMPAATVRSHVRRGLAALRKELE